MAATTIATSWSTTILGPLTTTWTPPPACSVVVAACSTCTKGWAAQSCPRDSLVTDDPSCWPPRTSGAYTPPTGTPLFAWGIYTPGIVCPQGYSAACSYDGAAQTGDFQFDFSPRETEAATGCCPTGYTCDRVGAQTCSLVLTSSTNAIATVTCESGTSAAYGYLTVPFAAIDTSRIVSISTFTARAPLFQLVHQISTTSSTSTSTTSTSTTSTSTSSTTTSSTTSTLSQQISPPSQAVSPPTNSSQNQGMSAGTAAGIGCGVGLCGILLGAAAFFVYRYRKRKTRGDGEVKLIRELPAYPPVLELGSNRGPVELEARHEVISQPPYGQAPHSGFQVRY
ncbi:hypothetical protein F4821DRAFT_137443 [Hypoxylon rubiginosum]|uniref:Uncharacterized protein n=1 Tax=Hypoxylon rubiginosum TaxID=110542 RepID=A0ACC0DJ77_9PEZI|nr:hypothetical protein F4821DRAFT_137443 [Hypoxylon rubiginosum]